MRLSRLARGIQVGLVWSKAQGLVEKGMYDKALESMGKAYALLGASPPSQAAPLSANLLVAQIAYRLRNPVLTLDALRIVIGQLRQRDHRYATSDVDHIVLYVRELSEYSAGRFPGKASDFLGRAAEVSTLPLEGDHHQARPDLRRIFPLTPEEVGSPPAAG